MERFDSQSRSQVVTRGWRAGGLSGPEVQVGWKDKDEEEYHGIEKINRPVLELDFCRSV